MSSNGKREPSDAEAETRLKAILRGAFAGPPTPLKEVPTRTGERRKVKVDSSGAHATSKTVRPES